MNVLCIEQSTNIIEILEKLVPAIDEYDQLVVTEKIRLAKNINIVEEHFISRGISVPRLKNETKNELAKGRNGRNAQAIAEAKRKLASIAVYGGPNKYPDEDPDEKRIINKITKTEFFKKIKNEYEHWQNGIYKRKCGAKGIEDAEFLKWDYRHNDVEAYSKGQTHLGSINPNTLKLYKPPVIPRAML